MIAHFADLVLTVTQASLASRYRTKPAENTQSNKRRTGNRSLIGPLCDHAQHHRRKQRKQERRFKMGKFIFGITQLFFLVAISNASTIARMFSSPAVTRNLVP